MNIRSALIIIAVLTLITVSVYGYTLLVDENTRLIAVLSMQESTIRLGQSQKLDLFGRLREVTGQGQELRKEYLSLKEQLRASQLRISALGTSYYRLTGLNAALAASIDRTAQENSSLTRGRDSLETQFADFVKENEAYRARLGSVDELKKAIHEVTTHRLGTR